MASKARAFSKRCPRCKTKKPRAAFTNAPSKSDGLHTYCRKCQNEVSNDWHKKSRRNPKKRDRYREYDLKKKFGITLVEYENLLQSQNGGCAICGSDVRSHNGGDLVVDHDHKWGHIRGLLCGDCNYGLGNFFDNIDYLSNAIEYLKTTGMRALANV